MTGNIIGEQFEDYVLVEINNRQIAHGSKQRSHGMLNYLTNRNAWIKMGSSISLEDPQRLVDVTQEELGVSIPLSTAEKYSGVELAKNFVLFNGVSKLNSSNTNYIFRSGVKRTTKILDDFSSYGGIGGSNQGLQPTPGIVSLNIETINRGSIRRARVELAAFNKLQFSIIELLYLRLGSTMLIEWGWDKYLTNGGNQVAKMENTLMEDLWFQTGNITQLGMLQNIETARQRYRGNYDGFFGKVTNFQWNFNNDGSYSITIDLITLGDVVESLTANVGFKGMKTSDINNLRDHYQNRVQKYGDLARNFVGRPIAGDVTKDFIFDVVSVDILSNWLLTKTITYDSKNEPSHRTDFYNIRQGAYNQYKQVLDVFGYFNFYITLGSLLEFIEKNIIPKIKFESRVESYLEIDTDVESNLCSGYLNQVSLDPTVCLINPKFDERVSEFVDNPRFLTERLKEFTVVNDRVVYGKLMNLYLSVDFVIRVLRNNINSDGDVTLFGFLSEMLNGVNTALGSYQKLEPVIKEDKFLTIIDQNPIPGIQRVAGSLGLPKLASTDTVELEVFGYTGDRSNFVKNVSFSTELDSSLASLISIGASAAGTSTKNFDATAFSKWNEGLVDRFNPEVVELTYDPNVEKVYEDHIRDIDDRISKGKALVNKEAPKLPRFPIINLSFATDKHFKAYAKNGSGEDEFIGYKYGSRIFLKKDGYTDTGPGLKRFYLKVYRLDQQEKANKRAIEGLAERLATEVQNSYEAWLVSAFGGTIPKLGLEKSPEDVKYFDFDEIDFFLRGRRTFKEYVNNANNSRFKEIGEPSNVIGFIPVTFDIDMEGISGMKIYNRVNIQQRFLPPQYPKALNFVITGLNHVVTDQDWTTSLNTISTAQTTTPQGNPLTPDQLRDLEKRVAEQEAAVLLPDSDEVEDGNSPLDRTLTSNYPLWHIDQSGKRQIYPRFSSYVDSENKVGLRRIYFDEETRKNKVVLHHTRGWSNQNGRQNVEDWRRRGSPNGTHYIISQNGHVENTFDEKYWSYHSGINQGDKKTIGIELEAIGPATLTGDGFVVSAGYERVELTKELIRKNINTGNTGTDFEVTDFVATPLDDQGNPRAYRGHLYYQKYSEPQLRALKKLLLDIKARNPQIPYTFDYDRIFPDQRVIESNDPPPGIYTHNSFTNDQGKNVFPQKELIDLLKEISGGQTAFDNAEGYKIKRLVIENVKTIYGTLAGQVREYPPNKSGDGLGTELGRLAAVRDRLIEAIKNDSDTDIKNLFLEGVGIYSTTEARLRWAGINLSASPNYDAMKGKGYLSPNGLSSQSKLESRWEELTGSKFSGLFISR